MQTFKNFIAPFYGWGSTVSKLQSHFKERIYFLPLRFPGTHLVSTTEG